ncbi:MAG: hypothetical protein JNK78_14125 [Planctomycetes bacterium]|nr:hypothetical protein [Planctomycetota bacterium]
MFEALNAASPANKYQLGWVELAPVQFQAEVPKWLAQIGKSALTGGPQQAQRVALVDEFARLLQIQKQILQKQGGASVAVDVGRAEENVRWFGEAVKKKFGAAPKTPAPETGLQPLLDRNDLLAGKLAVLDEKLQLVNYWLRGVKTFPEHREGQSLLFQYLGNAPNAKVRLILEVLCADAGKAVSFKEPGAFKTSYGFDKGLVAERKREVAWTDERFKRAVKGELGAAYGVQAKGQCELEFSGFKAKLEGEAWAGVRAKMEGEAGFGAGSGAFAKGSVEAEIGIKLKGVASIDCADVFLCEASAEAFAGAMAKGEVEVTVTVGQVTVKASAEAFAGARLVGEAKATLRLQGYDLLKAEAKGALTAGVGGKAEFELQCSLFGGSSLEVEAGATLGVGAEGGTKFTVHAGNIAPALAALYYSVHLGLLGQKKEKYVWKTYFRELGQNERLFEKARGVIEEQMKTLILERNRLFTEFSAWKQLEGLATFRRTGAV